jgi:hypothetical protein
VRDDTLGVDFGTPAANSQNCSEADTHNLVGHEPSLDGDVRVHLRGGLRIARAARRSQKLLLSSGWRVVGVRKKGVGSSQRRRE